MADLGTGYMGSDLGNPLIGASGGLDRALEGVKRCVGPAAGAAGRWHGACVFAGRGRQQGGNAMMKKEQDEYIRRALAIARELKALADEGDAERSDDGCAVLYGVVRDCAYKIQAEAEREQGQHEAKAIWQDGEG